MERWVGAQRGATHPGNPRHTYKPRCTRKYTHTQASGETGASESSDPSLALAGVGGSGVLVGRSPEQGLTLEK